MKYVLFFQKEKPTELVSGNRTKVNYANESECLNKEFNNGFYNIYTKNRYIMK